MKESANTPVSFAIPEPLLDQLRRRRDQNRAKRPPAAPSRGEREYLSTVDLVRSAGSKDHTTDLVRAFVDGMNDLQTEVEEQYDAFLLDPGMGPMTYLAADGRILHDNRTWDGEGIVVETSLDDAIMALVVGAKKAEIVDLLALIPALANASVCPRCAGKRWMKLHPAAEFEIVCQVCFGRGEIDERLLQRVRERGGVAAS